MKPHIKYLLQTIRAKGERDFVKKNQSDEPKLSQNREANNASNASIGNNGKEPFSGPGVAELEGAKTLRASNLPGEDAAQYEELSAHEKSLLATRKAKKNLKLFTVNMKHKTTGEKKTTTVLADSPDDALDKAEVKHPDHEVEKALRHAREETELTLTDILDEAMRLTPKQKQKREDLVKSMESQKAQFQKRYGERWQNEMYATATRMVIGELIDPETEIKDSVEVLVEKYLEERLSDAKIKKGALHKQEGIKQDKKIGMKNLEKIKKKAKKHHNTKEQRRAQWAININKNKHHKEEVNEDVMGIASDFANFGDGAKKLIFHAENTPHLQEHTKSYIANMARRMKKGTYEPEKGKKLWSYYIDHAMRDWAHEHADGGSGKSHFTPEERHQAASHFEKKHREKLQNNIHEEVVEDFNCTELIDDMRLSVIDDSPLILEFVDGTEKVVKPKKLNLFLNLFDSIDKDDQEDLVIGISSNYDAFKDIINECNPDEPYCHHCGKSLDKMGSMMGLLDHIETHKVPRETARRAIMRQSHRDVDSAINVPIVDAPAPTAAIPVRVV